MLAVTGCNQGHRKWIMVTAFENCFVACGGERRNLGCAKNIFLEGGTIPAKINE